VRRATDGHILRRTTEVETGAQVEAKLSKGVLLCTVDEKRDE
jgi:hypothetical protein